MRIVERHVIKSLHPFYKECDDLCLHSKNLYNSSLYITRQHFFKTHKYINLKELYHKAKLLNEYKELPAKVSNQTIKLLDKNFKSFFKLLKNKDVKNNIPGYLDSAKGRFVVKYEKGALSKKVFKNTGLLKLSKTNIEIKTQITDFNIIKEVRIVPKANHFVIEVVYIKEEKESVKSEVIAGIDPGLDNLATVAFNDANIKPFIINGRPVKSMNQYYNKIKSKIVSKLKKEEEKDTSKRVQKLSNKRNFKVLDYLHKSSRMLVNQLVSSHVSTLVIGKNVGQKQDSNMGKKNNQNFTSLPLFRFLDIIAYKAELEGIKVQFQEESYTSKSSFLNMDLLPVYEDKNIPKFSGYRQSRGIYKIKRENRYINADVNGALNIIRKAFPKEFDNYDGIEGFAVNPVRLNVTV